MNKILFGALLCLASFQALAQQSPLRNTQETAKSTILETKSKWVEDGKLVIMLHSAECNNEKQALQISDQGEVLKKTCDVTYFNDQLLIQFPSSAVTDGFIIPLRDFKIK